MQNTPVTVIAGPCSINEENQEQLFDIAKITVSKALGYTVPAIWGVRVVGLKSRTTMDANGKSLGMDYPVYKKNLERYVRGGSIQDFEMLPSILVAKKLIEETKVVVATEVVDPLMQLPLYERILPKGTLMTWNPAVNQLGYQSLVMGQYAIRNGWFVGIKNGKWLGDVPSSGMSTMEKAWIGLSSFASGGNLSKLKDKLIMIHRGVDVAGKGNYRNLPVHEAAERIKSSLPIKLFFDPSHSHGPSLRNQIVEETVVALKRTTSNGDYLYDGLLIEVGTSTTDTDQHISIDELSELCDMIATFRDFYSPERP